ncbi:MAG: CHAT domain-containing protein [Myxococcota bacterium]
MRHWAGWLLALTAACSSRATSSPEVAVALSPAPTLDPLLLAGRVGLELIDAKGEQVRSRADVYEPDVFTVRSRPATLSGCTGIGEPASFVELGPGQPFEMTITNHAASPFIPHVLEYRGDGLVILDLEASLDPGESLTHCVDGLPGTGDFLARVVGTRQPSALDDTVMYQTARDIAFEDPDNTEARALSTLLENENRQRLTLARLLHAQGQPLPEEMVLGRVVPEGRQAVPDPVFVLPDDAALLVYAEIDGALTAAWYEAGQDAFAVPLEASAQTVDDLVDGFVASLAGSGAVARAPHPRGLERLVPDPPLVNPTALGDALLPPRIRSRLGAVQQLVIVPARSLGRLPWYAVEVDGAPLVASHTLAVAPDLVALDRAPTRWSADFTAPLVIGNPTLTAADFPEWDLPPLPGAAAEARAVAGRMETEALVGEAATYDAVLDRVGQADLVYLATHGVADRTAPLWDSFVALSGGRWRAVDVLTADLGRARLAVLSACQTGLGQDVDAGTIGLARSFYKAGVPRVVMSLWNVDDEGTKSLMLSFFDGLDEVPPAEALRRAADGLRQQGVPASVWASFSFLGRVDPRPR